MRSQAERLPRNPLATPQGRYDMMQPASCGWVLGKRYARGGIVKKLALIAAAMGFMAYLLCHPSSSLAWQSGNYARQLVNANCPSQGIIYKNGCNAYFAKRLDRQNTPDEALDGCEAWCGKIYGEPSEVGKCRAACQNMRNGE